MRLASEFMFKPGYNITRECLLVLRFILWVCQETFVDTLPGSIGIFGSYDMCLIYVHIHSDMYDLSGECFIR